MIARSPEREALITENLRLVPWIARRFATSASHGALEWDDVVADGYVGLVRAADTYDSSIGRFSTHAFWPIVSAMQKGIRRRDYLTFGDYNVLQEIRRLERRLGDELGRPPTLEEMAEAFDTPERKARAAGVRGRPTPMLRDYLERERIARPASLDAPVAMPNGKPGTMHDVIPSAEPDPADVAVDLEGQRRVEALMDLANLTAKERTVVHLRFGDDPRTLRDVGREIALTPERVRQIELKALRKMRYAVAREQQRPRPTPRLERDLEPRVLTRPERDRYLADRLVLVEIRSPA